MVKRLSLWFPLLSLLAAPMALADLIEVGTEPDSSEPNPFVTPYGTGSVEEDVEAQIARITQGLRAVKPRVDAGMTFNGGDVSGAIRFGLDGIAVDAPTGDLELLRFDAIYLPGAGGFRLRMKLAEATTQFFCTDSETGETHLPGVALFNNCVPEGLVGVGGELLDFQWDIRTKRVMARWLEANVVVNFLKNGNGLEYLNARLLGFLGASLDTVFPGQVPNPPSDSTVLMPRANMGVTGMIRTAGNRLEIRGYAGYRPNMLDFGDYAFEGETEVLYNFLFGQNILFQAGVNAAASYWSAPSHSIGDMASDRDSESLYVGGMFRLMFR